MNALIQIATDKADIPIVQTNKILIFFSFPQSDNIFVLARDGRTLEDLSLVSLSSSTFDSSNFLQTITCNNGQHKFKQGISFAVEPWDKITLNPATINIT